MLAVDYERDDDNEGENDEEDDEQQAYIFLHISLAREFFIRK
jgi:hypothetical protein